MPPYSKYDDHKANMAARQAKQSKEGRDIAAKIPSEPEDPERRAKCEANFQLWLTTYFPERFFMDFSPDHVTVVKEMERVIRFGGSMALAMPRGTGKTTLCECAVVFAALGGFHQYTMLIGADSGAALQSLENIKQEMEYNDLLFADYPLELGPFRMLEGIAARAKGQLYQGKRTGVKFTKDEVLFGNIEGSATNGSLFKVAGITGRIRGAKHGVVRPTLAVVDDCQTEESAKSHLQTEQRLKILRKAVMGLAGPSKKTSVLFPCTIIEKGDMAHQVLDREKCPEFKGIVAKLVYEWPDNEKMWERYAELWKQDLIDGNDLLPRATEFYRKNQKKMDKGARVAWEERKEEWEVSALQNAYNLRLRVGDDAFFSEYQNAPRAGDDDPNNITIPELQFNNRKRGIVPERYSRVFVGVDVQKAYIVYVVLAVSDDFDIAVIEYGTYPDQGKEFTRRKCQETLEQRFAGCGEDGALLRGMVQFINFIKQRVYKKEDTETELKAEKVMIDAGWKMGMIAEAIRQTDSRQLCHLIKGKSIRAQDKPLSEYNKGNGYRFGDFWYIPPAHVGKLPLCLVDGNGAKTFLQHRMTVPDVESGSFVVHGQRRHHALFAAQMGAEYGVKVTAKERSVYQWELKAGAPDNDFFDAVVYAIAGASMGGCKLKDKLATKKKKIVAAGRAKSRFVSGNGFGGGRSFGFGRR